MFPTDLASQIRGLSLNDRIELVEEIWESIVVDSQSSELSDATKSELDRRLANREKNGGAGATWEEVKARLTQ